MEDTTTENPPIQENKPSKKSYWLIPLIITLVIASIGATYLFLSKNADLLPSDQSDQSEKMCKDVKIVFFPGGSEDDPFASVVYNGAKAAEAILGAEVEYVWSDWDSYTMVDQFKDAIDSSPDGIAMMGHPGSDALSPFIDEAERKNIIVTLVNVDIPEIREKYVSGGTGYVGQDVYGAGLILGRGAVRKYKLNAGDEVLVLGLFNKTGAMATRARRTDGIVDGLEEAGVVVNTVDVPSEVEADYTSDVSFEWFSDQINQYPTSKVLLVDHHGGVTPAVADHIKRMGKKPNELPYGGFDLSVETVEGIKSGYIGMVLDQQPYLQGYLPILQICLTKKYGFAGLYIDTGVGLIDNSNVDMVSDLVKQKIR
jgi:simple sugar transport system substrate-binding protein